MCVQIHHKSKCVGGKIWGLRDFHLFVREVLWCGKVDEEAFARLFQIHFTALTSTSEFFLKSAIFAVATRVISFASIMDTISMS